MSGAELLIDRHDGVVVMTINRAHVRNAINAAVAEALQQAMDDLDADPHARVGILTGAAGNFCTGMDLKAFAAGEPSPVTARGFAGMTALPARKPLIAAVEGWALAGGFELALSCDLIVAAGDAKFGLPEVKRGLIASAGGLYRLPKALPYPVAMRLALTGETLSAAEAAQHGLLAELVDPGHALPAAHNLATAIAANAPLAVAASKALVCRSRAWTDVDAFADNDQLGRSVAASADAHEGAAAFAEKRQPMWSGR